MTQKHLPFSMDDLRAKVQNLCNAAEELRPFVEIMRDHHGCDMEGAEDLVLFLPFAINIAAGLLGYITRDMFVDPDELDKKCEPIRKT